MPDINPVPIEIENFASYHAGMIGHREDGLKVLRKCIVQILPLFRG